MLYFMHPDTAALGLLISTAFYGLYFLVIFLFPRLAPNHQKFSRFLYFALACFIVPALFYPLQYILDIVSFFLCMFFIISAYLFFSADIIHNIIKPHPFHTVVAGSYVLLYAFNLLPPCIYTLLLFTGYFPVLTNSWTNIILSYIFPFVWLVLLLFLRFQLPKLFHLSHKSTIPALPPSS